MTSENCSHRDCNCTASSNVCNQSLDEMDFERGIWSSAMNGEIKRIQTLIDKGTDVNNKDSSGYTALHYACRNGHIDACELLLREGAKVNAQTRSGKVTPLHRAAYCGHEDIVEILLQHGADPTLKDADGQTALHKAAEKGHMNIVKHLLASSDTLKDIRDNRQRLPWELSSSEDIVTFLKP